MGDAPTSVGAPMPLGTLRVNNYQVFKIWTACADLSQHGRWERDEPVLVLAGSGAVHMLRLAVRRIFAMCRTVVRLEVHFQCDVRARRVAPQRGATPIEAGSMR